MYDELIEIVVKRTFVTKECLYILDLFIQTSSSWSSYSEISSLLSALVSNYHIALKLTRYLNIRKLNEYWNESSEIWLSCLFEKDIDINVVNGIFGQATNEDNNKTIAMNGHIIDLKFKSTLTLEIVDWKEDMNYKPSKIYNNTCNFNLRYNEVRKLQKIYNASVHGMSQRINNVWKFLIYSKYMAKKQKKLLNNSNTKIKYQPNRNNRINPRSENGGRNIRLTHIDSSSDEAEKNTILTTNLEGNKTAEKKNGNQKQLPIKPKAKAIFNLNYTDFLISFSNPINEEKDEASNDNN